MHGCAGWGHNSSVKYDRDVNGGLVLAYFPAVILDSCQKLVGMQVMLIYLGYIVTVQSQG